MYHIYLNEYVKERGMEVQVLDLTITGRRIEERFQALGQAMKAYTFEVERGRNL